MAGHYNSQKIYLFLYTILSIPVYLTIACKDPERLESPVLLPDLFLVSHVPTSIFRNWFSLQERLGCCNCCWWGSVCLPQVIPGLLALCLHLIVMTRGIVSGMVIVHFL